MYLAGLVFLTAGLVCVALQITDIIALFVGQYLWYFTDSEAAERYGRRVRKAFVAHSLLALGFLWFALLFFGIAVSLFRNQT